MTTELDQIPRADPRALGGAVASDRWERLPGPVQRLADLGADAADDEEERLQRRVLNLTAALMAAFTPIWTITYLALGLELPAAIPFVYMCATVVFIET